VIPVTVIDYKAGNLTSVVKALRYLDAEVTVTDRAQDVGAATRVILPGVGHFAATRRLDETKITPAVRDAIARVEFSSRTALSACAQGDDLRRYLSRVRGYASHDPVNAIALRRQIAGRLLANERYTV